MGKIRDGLDDVRGLTQYLGRKIINHAPMLERDAGKSSRNKVIVGIVQDDPVHVIYALKNGKRFCISVREMPLEEEMPVLVAVGA